MAQVLVAVVHKWNIKVPDDNTLLYEKYEKESLASRQLLHTMDLRLVGRSIQYYIKTHFMAMKLHETPTKY